MQLVDKHEDLDGINSGSLKELSKLILVLACLQTVQLISLQILKELEEKGIKKLFT